MQWQLALFLAIWLFYFGACIGSFLNVVIYRLPAGLRLWKPNSRCPECLHAIRWYDNLPIISWMNLGGHCRDCQTTIAARYPFVELLMGAIFLCVGVFEGISIGANLPTLLATLWTSWLVCGAHLVLLSVLVSAAFMQLDGHRPPAKLFGFAAFVGFFVVWFEPGMVPHRGAGFHDHAMVTMVAGLIAGGLIGAAVTFAGSASRGGYIAILPWAITGQFLGWQAACWIGILTALLVASRASTRGSLSKAPTLGLLVAVMIPWIICWSAIVEVWPQWTIHADASLMAIALMFAAAIAVIENRRAPLEGLRGRIGSIRNLQHVG